MENKEGNAMMEERDTTKNVNLVENEPVQTKTVEREDEEVINETVSYSSTTDNGLNNLGTSIEEKGVIQETLTEDAVTCSMENKEDNAMMEERDTTKNVNLVENEAVQTNTLEREDEEVINETVSYSSTTDNGLNSLGTSIEEKGVIQEKLTEDAVTCSMENDKDNAMMEVLHATKNLNLVENEAVQSKTVVEREDEEAIKETVSYRSTSASGLNSMGTSIEEKGVIQEKLTEDAVMCSIEKKEGNAMIEEQDKAKNLNLVENEPVQPKDNGMNSLDNSTKQIEIQETLKDSADSYHQTPSPEILETSSDSLEIPSEPGQPIGIDSTSNSVELAWNPPEKGLKCIDSYEIKYKQCNTRKAEKWIPVVTETSRRTVTVTDLKCGTDYEFKVRAVNKDGDEGPFSPKLKMSTKMSLAKTIQLDAKKIGNGNPSVFKLPLFESRSTTNFKAKTRKCTFGRKSVNCREKTIMLVGATGSGKSTLINGIINYITDVSWEDDFRFSLVDLTDDEKKKHANQSESQTEWITFYAINKMDGSKIDYDLNIIDTPGFGDTRGIIRDKAIVDQIREFFTTPGEQGIAFLDAVCFVTQAPLVRLTHSQRYIFDAILSVFGQDIASNIYVLITFADGNDPPVRSALKKANVPFQCSYKFNNSALFASPGKSDESSFGNLFWKMGQESFRIFLEDLKLVESRSLQLTAEVLQTRKCLEVTIQGLQPQIVEGMNQLNTIRQEREILEKHKTDIAANRNFDYEVEEIHVSQIDLEAGLYVTNCITCNRTCHFPCCIPDDENKRGCAAMSNGSCTVCPSKCHWSMHKNNSFRFETYPVTVKRTYDQLKQKYEIAQQEEKRHRSVIGKVKGAFSSVGTKVMKMVSDVRGYINKLNAIALRPNPLSDLDYIDLLIESEKNERKYGWEQRLKLFNKMRNEAVLMRQTANANYRPWGEDEDIVNDHS